MSSSDDDFQKRFHAAPTQIEKVKLCIHEGRYIIVTRKDKLNLNGSEYLRPILDLPLAHPYRIKPRQSGEVGKNFVIDFEYKATIRGAELIIYFKGFFGTNGALKLVVQSLRKAKEE